MRAGGATLRYSTWIHGHMLNEHWTDTTTAGHPESTTMWGLPQYSGNSSPLAGAIGTACTTSGRTSVRSRKNGVLGILAERVGQGEVGGVQHNRMSLIGTGYSSPWNKWAYKNSRLAMPRASISGSAFISVCTCGHWPRGTRCDLVKRWVWLESRICAGWLQCHYVHAVRSGCAPARL